MLGERALAKHKSAYRTLPASRVRWRQASPALDPDYALCAEGADRL